MHNFRELKIWQRALNLTEVVYKLVAEIPKEERIGLAVQIKRCAVAIPGNISEGAGKVTNKQFIYFL